MSVDFRTEPHYSSTLDYVFQCLCEFRAHVLDEPMDVRVQLLDGVCYVHSGDASYDTDHRGSWGASCVFADSTNEECRKIACDLLEQALEMEPIL